MQKERILEVVGTLPDDVNLDSLIEKLYLLRRLELAEEEIAAGKTVNHEEVEKRFAITARGCSTSMSSRVSG